LDIQKAQKESTFSNKGKTLEEVIHLGLTQRRNIPEEDMKRGNVNSYIYLI